ncbi:MAG: cell division protein FtsA [Firmicutes bacterium]|nr:cell division protein FtsA [Bacillota bacterium]
MIRDYTSRLGFLFRRADDGPVTRIALDIGTEYVKAVILELTDAGPKVLGVGRARQDYANMEGGAVANIAGVTACCTEAVEQAAVIAGLKPKEAVLGIAGQFVHGVSRTVERQRSRAEKPLTVGELRSHFQDAQKEALDSVTKKMKERLGYQKLEVELVNSSLVSMTIDGHPVNNPLDFPGRNLEFSIFMTFAPLVHAGAMRTIADRLGLKLVGMIAEPYAVAASSLTDEAYEFGSLVIDMGGGSTDIALVQQRGVVATKMVPMGGRAFTKGIAARLHKTLREAEQLKMDYSDGVGSMEIGDIIQADLEIWLDAVLLALRDIYTGTPLPHHIALCGGGSCLPGVAEMLRSDKLAGSGMFSQRPEVILLRPDHIYGISDPKEFFRGQQDVTPKAIAYQAAVIQGSNHVLGGALRA